MYEMSYANRKVNPSPKDDRSLPVTTDTATGMQRRPGQRTLSKPGSTRKVVFVAQSASRSRNRHLLQRLYLVLRHCTSGARTSELEHPMLN